MTLGERIESRRLAIGISQAELARRVGVRQSTINSLIKGDSRTSRSLLKIARELRTTPAFLTGETNDPQADAPGETPLTFEQREVVELMATLRPADRRALLQVVRAMAGKVEPATFEGSSSTIHAPGSGFKGPGE